MLVALFKPWQPLFGNRRRKQLLCVLRVRLRLKYQQLPPHTVAGLFLQPTLRRVRDFTPLAIQRFVTNIN